MVRHYRRRAAQEQVVAICLCTCVHAAYGLRTGGGGALSDGVLKELDSGGGGEGVWGDGEGAL